MQKRFRFGRLTILFVLFLTLPGALRAADRADRLAALRAQVEAGVEKFKREELNTKPGPEVRHLTDAAFSILALGNDPKTAESFLRLALAQQNMDQKSPTFGMVAWQIGNPEISDSNSIEFTMATLLPAVLRYGGQLSQPFRDELPPHIRAAITAMRNHNVPVTYTNIYLMKLANLIMAGELCGDTSAVEDGKKNLDAWMDFTRKNGITEYDSPTYSVVHLVCLEDAYIHAPDAGTKEKAKKALDYVWSDLAANYFPGRDSLGGPHSRSYNFLYEEGTIQHHYYLAGLSPTLIGKDYLGGVWLNAISESAYEYPAEITELGRIPERVVEERFGAASGRLRYNYITPGFDIGCTSAYYGPQDLQVSAEFASAKKLPVISVRLDAFDAPFGIVKTRDPSGHIKPKHLRNVIAAVQDKGSILALQDLSPELAREPRQSVATNIVFPEEADEVYVNDRKMEHGKVFDVAANPQTTVFLHEGNTAAALRIFAADGCAGTPALFRVKSDGDETGAARLVAYHYQGKAVKLKDKTVRSGVFLHMEGCADSAAFTAFRARMGALKISQTGSGPVWEASVKVGETELAAGVNVETKEIAFRKVNGEEKIPHNLSVNGKDIAAAILGAKKSSAAPETTPAAVK